MMNIKFLFTLAVVCVLSTLTQAASDDHLKNTLLTLKANGKPAERGLRGEADFHEAMTTNHRELYWSSGGSWWCS
ncbi:MAG: hypothetical protein SGILL_010272, partial [Bacillariaceae sp.]